MGYWYGCWLPFLLVYSNDCETIFVPVQGEQTGHLPKNPCRNGNPSGVAHFRLCRQYSHFSRHVFHRQHRELCAYIVQFQFARSCWWDTEGDRAKCFCVCYCYPFRQRHTSCIGIHEVWQHVCYEMDGLDSQDNHIVFKSYSTPGSRKLHCLIFWMRSAICISSITNAPRYRNTGSWMPCSIAISSTINPLIEPRHCNRCSCIVLWFWKRRSCFLWMK